MNISSGQECLTAFLCYSVLPRCVRRGDPLIILFFVALFSSKVKVTVKLPLWF